MNDTSNDANAKAGATIIPVSPFQQNCTLLWCNATRRAVAVDPAGDVPLNDSVGDCDLPGRDHATLIKPVTGGVVTLGDGVGFVCGRGHGSSIGDERETNPVLNGMT